MVCRRRRGFAALLTALALVAASCSTAADGEEPTASTSGRTTTTTSTTIPPVTTLPPTTTSSTAPEPQTNTSVPDSTTTSVGFPEIGAEVLIPEGVGPFPSVVLVHGGGWVAGDPSIMRPLANYLTDAGYITVNTPYKLSDSDAGFPQAVDDVACAVRYAAAHPDSDGTVALIGHSAGAHISAIVALTGDLYGDSCPIPGSGIPDKFIGLAGPYDVDRLGIVMLPFFGVGPNGDPEAWLAGNPQLLTDQNPSLESLIMYGDLDGLVEPSFATGFHTALTDSGSTSLLELVEGARHNNLREPDWVGDLIVVWLER